MRNCRLALLIVPVLLVAACDSNSVSTSPDAKDAIGDRSTTEVKAETAGDVVTEAKGDTPADVPTEGPPADGPIDAPTDTPTDGGTDGDAATDVPAAEGGGSDAGDAATDQAEARPPKLVTTVLVVDKPPTVDGGSDAGSAAGTDAASDGPTMPAIDPNLVNPWGLAFNPAGPIWVANNGTGTATVYNAQGVPFPIGTPLIVTIPPQSTGTPPSSPTGQVFNPTSGFMADKFIFSSENGTIAGWQAGTAAVTRADNATSMAVYKGLALALRNNVPRLYATDFHNGKVDVYDTGYNKITTSGGFADAMIPAGFAPFGIMANGSAIYVTYAKQDATAKDDVAGAGNGYVDLFDFDGVLVKRLVAKGALNSPWGLALAPSDFGSLSQALLVGNFGDGKINAYDPASGAFLMGAIGSNGSPLVIDGLWALVFGPDVAGAAHNQLFFTAGPNDEMNGMLGRLDFVP
jgi:uncharacterized protein (TIGR03118 family)